MLKEIIKSLFIKIIWPLLPNGIYVFTYHRIGNAEKTQFDPNVFSCTAALFEQHIKFYNREFAIISVDELIEKIENHRRIDKKYAVITFDDGYLDNYSTAFPILKQYSTPAAFYIVTSYLDTPCIPWWDKVAWIIRHSKTNSIKLKTWSNALDVSTGSVAENIRAVLDAIKQEQTRSMEEKIMELEEVCECKISDDVCDVPLFVNWEQAKEMSNSGMHIGSHTLNHRILSHLSNEDQETEITKSKFEIEYHLEKEVTSIVYPVGGKTSFTSHSQAFAKQANYKVAFSYIPGVIQSFKTDDRYQLKRLPVDGNCEITQLKYDILKFSFKSIF